MRQDSGGGKSFLQRLGPLAGGMLTAILLGLTLLAAVVLGMQEQDLVAVATPSGMPTAMAPATTVAMPAAPTPSPTASPASLPTPSPVPPSATPQPTAEARCVPPTNWRLYVVRRGESLSTLAWRYWTSERSLVQANCLKTYAVSSGQRIYVPDVSPRQSCGRPSGWVAYTIRRGDTLSSIAVRVGTTVSALKQGNCLSSDKILAGAALWVPRLPAPPPTSTRRPTATRRPTNTPSLTPGTETASPTPSASGEPATATPTGTPVTGTPTNTPGPGTPTDTPAPTGTSSPGTPTNTPAPSNTPQPTGPPTSSPTSSPTSPPTSPPPTPTEEPAASSAASPAWPPMVKI